MIAIDYSAYRSVASYDSRVRFLVLHYTSIDFKKSIDALTGKSVSAHYLVPDPTDPSYIAAGYKDVSVFNLVDEKERAWHAGFSCWEGRTNLNDSSIGIELVNLAQDDDGKFIFPDYNEKQQEAVIELVINILQRYPTITATRVVGHSDISFNRKSDPGPRFPWYALYLRGAGAWPDTQTKKERIAQFTCNGLPPKEEIVTSFRRYGYDASQKMSDKDYIVLVRAFQLHFRQDCYDGVMDAETCGTLYALNDKYKK